VLYALSRKIIILLNVFSRYNFQKAVNQPSGDRHSRGMSCWDQFVIVLFCHLAKAKSLREIIGGIIPLSLRGKINETFQPLLRQCTQPLENLSVRLLSILHPMPFFFKRDISSRFKNKLLSIDATVIDLCASIFNWAKFRQAKGGVKLHMSLDHDGFLPSYAYSQNLVGGDIGNSISRLWNPPQNSKGKIWSAPSVFSLTSPTN